MINRWRQAVVRHLPTDFRAVVRAACRGLLPLAAMFAASICPAETPRASQAAATTKVLDAVKASVSYLEPIDVHVDKEGLSLISGVRFRLDRCHTVLYWRPKGQSAWVESTGAFEETKGPPHDLSFRVAFGELDANIAVKRFIDDRVWRFSGTLMNRGKRPVELARFHYLRGTAPAGISFLELLGPRQQPRLCSGQAQIAARADVEQFWAGMGVKWPRLAEPIHDQVGWFVSSDTAALIEKWNSPGWGFGFVGPGNAFGEIGYRGREGGPQVFLGVLLDNVVLDPGETRTLEEAIVWCGDWQSGLDVWARTCAAECGAGAPAAPLVGYCSWYQKGSGITAEDIERAAREFAAWPVPPGGRTIQIDDGFQSPPANWDPNEKFNAAWPGLARRIAATGSVPGLWLAPTTVHESDPIVRQHPDWLQRLPNGEPAISFGNWGRTFYLEPDHPGVRAFIRNLFKRVCAEGWKYYKIDFTYPVTAARVPYDRKKTEFQTLRDMYALFREAVGPDVLLNACVGNPTRYALGYVDSARLGGDVGFNYDGIHATVRQLLTRTASNGVWFSGDPDVFTMRNQNLGCSADEKRILTGTVGLFGGLFLTSDYPTQWNLDDIAFVRQFWTKQGPRPPRHQYVVWNADGEVVAYRVSYGDSRPPAHRFAIYSWSGTAKAIRLRLSDARLPPKSAMHLSRDAVAVGVELADGTITVPNQPPHSLRVVDLLEGE
jgi:hypothetical protein